jgi:hypothetical protein
VAAGDRDRRCRLEARGPAGVRLGGGGDAVSAKKVAKTHLPPRDVDNRNITPSPAYRRESRRILRFSLRGLISSRLVAWRSPNDPVEGDIRRPPPRALHCTVAQITVTRM